VYVMRGVAKRFALCCGESTHWTRLGLEHREPRKRLPLRFLSGQAAPLMQVAVEARDAEKAPVVGPGVNQVKQTLNLITQNTAESESAPVNRHANNTAFRVYSKMSCDEVLGGLP
jgi:hypothetical protein